MKGFTDNLEIRHIRTDGGTQARVGLLDERVVSDYAQDVTEGAIFPPVVVFFDGTHYWLADGFHRVAAFKLAQKLRIPAEISQGSLRDAQLYAAGANASHGLRRSRDDKYHAVTMLLNDAEWVQWSDREIARRCRVSPSSVSKIRRELGLTVQMDSENGEEGRNGRKYITKHGTESVMTVAVPVKTAIKNYLVARFKTVDPAVLASNARAITNHKGELHTIWSMLQKQGPAANHEAIFAALVELAHEWQALVPVPVPVPPPAPDPVISRFVTIVRTIPEIDLRAVRVGIQAIHKTYPADGYPELIEYANALEELICVLRPN